MLSRTMHCHFIVSPDDTIVAAILVDILVS